ncbi:bcl-2 homologous antagonist/killer-like [Mercenaria mercenaria]|uniref:bcl-2 homologous antagonist/killer-like n=1 Tax=Mercenaria mercenaria TaxID=6596 RepID=UPI00234F2A44|nr:bcl-2 homologous antagonist/killer-like [Mercenaria mercenaria]XP_053396272.1 bcl-2 homologous antagonist/killer-like [Mercenaria mercenaria]
MASNDGGGDIPHWTGSAQKQIPSPEQFSPDSEQNVIDQTEDVFQNFLYESWSRDNSRGMFVEQVTPNVPQLTNFTADPLSASAQVGRRLAKIGDDINQKYQPEFDHMIDKLQVDKSTAYDAFAGVARRLVEGGLNWGRIATLFSFGYRIFVRVIGIGEAIKEIGKVLGRIVSNIVTFIKDASQGIARWIAGQGGWRSALSYVPTVSWQVLTGIAVAAVATLGIVYYLHNSGK